MIGLCQKCGAELGCCAARRGGKGVWRSDGIAEGGHENGVFDVGFRGRDAEQLFYAREGR
jgi:hypothetical protein